MANVHRFYSLTNDEFISMISSKRESSPIIDELCRRIENLIEDQEETYSTGDRTLASKCPVCEADLRCSGSVDTEGNILDFKLTTG